eukprot:972167_1
MATPYMSRTASLYESSSNPIRRSKNGTNLQTPKQHERRRSTPTALSRLSSKLKLRIHTKKIKSMSFTSGATSSILNDKITWRPTLPIIYKDELLLNTLTEFMTQSFNEENILFLQSVLALNNVTSKKIDSKIESIYALYINSNAEYQINLSYLCFTDILSKKGVFTAFDRTVKRNIFDLCVHEIERLIISSVLPSFYASKIFQNVARNSDSYPKESCVLSGTNEAPMALSLMDDSLGVSIAFSGRKIRSNKMRTPVNASLHCFLSPLSLSPVSSNSSSHSACPLKNSETKISNDVDLCATFHHE